jgi:hypothetical protein
VTLSVTELDAAIRAKLDELSPAERHLAEIRVRRIVRRKRALRRFPTPGHLAKFLYPDTIQTPMMAALDRIALECDAGFSRRHLISCPPQEGKSQRMGAVVPLWFLIRDPSRRIALASYEQSLAARNGLVVRQAIETYGAGYKGDRGANQDDELGLILDPDNAKQANWSLADVPGRRNGGIVSVGVGSAFTGRAVDVLIVDDPVKNAADADSPEQRKKSHNWYQAVAETRLAGNPIVVVIQTRWHEDDLMGWLIRNDDLEETPQWSRMFVPAIAGVKDPLGRKRGEYLYSARGRSPEDWDRIRKNVGERWWAALYMCEPAPPEGGVFKYEWITNNRVRRAPELSRIEVFVDPADNEGDGDEAGVIVAGTGVDDRYYVLDDLSEHMTVGRWFRVALLAALRHQATVIRYERSLSQLDKRAKQAWRDLLREALRLDEVWQRRSLPGQAWPRSPAGDVVDEAVHELARDDATPEERTQLEAALIELWPLVPAVLALPRSGIPVRALLAQGSKTFRAQMVSPVYEGGHVSHVGHFPELEHQMVSWMVGQDSPDRMDAAVHAVTELSRASGLVEMSGARGQMPTRPTVQIPRAGSTLGGGR